MEEITREIIQSASKGDSDAFEKIYRDTSGFVYNVALRMSGSCDTAAEITQEVFLKVYEKLSGFRQNSAFKTWLYRITINTSLNILSRNSRHNCRIIDITALPDIASPESPIHERAEKNAENDDIQRLLNLLPEKQKACILLRSVEGMSYKEISDALNINLNTVRTNLKRARETLIKRKGTNL